MGEYELFMPFILCESVGGPFKDDAFVAGWTLGCLDSKLAAAKHHSLGVRDGSPIFKQYLLQELLPQVDLIAMAHNAIATYGEVEDGDWVLSTFSWANDI